MNYRALAGDDLRAVREESQLDPRQFAALLSARTGLNVTATDLLEWERGTMPYPAGLLRAAADVAHAPMIVGSRALAGYLALADGTDDVSATLSITFESGNTLTCKETAQVL